MIYPCKSRYILSSYEIMGSKFPNECNFRDNVHLSRKIIFNPFSMGPEVGTIGVFKGLYILLSTADETYRLT